MTKDIPLAEITLRRYEKPYKGEKRDLIKKVCLSLGLLQPGDSRDVVVDILLVLTESSKQKEKLSSEQIKKRVERLRKENSLELRGIAESNIRRQLKKLRDLMFIEKKENLYYISEFADLIDIFESRIENFLLPQVLDRIKEYLKEIDGKGND